MHISSEYWAGSLEIHSLEGFGVDAFLQISKLGNKDERYVELAVCARDAPANIYRLTTRASMDAI
jgi:pyruvate dehydrogenase kinase 2/3/4